MRPVLIFIDIPNKALGIFGQELRRALGLAVGIGDGPAAAALSPSLAGAAFSLVPGLIPEGFQHRRGGPDLPHRLQFDVTDGDGQPAAGGHRAIGEDGESRHSGGATAQGNGALVLSREGGLHLGGYGVPRGNLQAVDG